jgi:ElaB/YqjD/DUF883 family membrane-anchored ribosome-binding protein
MTTEDTQRLGHATDQIKDSVTHQIQSLSGLIKKHPLISFGIGVGAGYLLARLVHR